MSGEAPCPRCGASTAAVSAVYVATLGALSAPASELPESLRALLGPDADLRGLLRVRALRRLAGLVAPPGGERRSTRALHPDLLAGGFAAILAVALAGAWRQQPEAARAGAAAAAAAGVLYAALRSRILRRHAQGLERERAASRAVEQGVALWMSLRCCLRERTVDGIEAWPAVPLDDLQQRLAAHVAAAAGSRDGARR